MPAPDTLPTTVPLVAATIAAYVLARRLFLRFGQHPLLHPYSSAPPS